MSGAPRLPINRKEAQWGAMHADESEKIFDDDDMWRVYDSQK
jgi:hypothetical protein